MTSSSAPTIDKTPVSQAKAALPLFYIRPEPLTAERHGTLRLKAEADFTFAAQTNAVPIMASEFSEAMRFYPIVFAGEPAHPITVMGLKTDNLFVDARGQWAAAHYIPAYVRRYPFVFIDAGAQGFALGIDMGCDRLETTSSEAADGALSLFNDGKPTDFTQGTLQFCSALQTDHTVTRAFTDALIEQELLIDQHAQGETAGGERFAVQGFRIVDAQKFAALPDAVIADWHKKGWLGLVHLHLTSLNRWRDLLDRQPSSVEAPVTEPLAG